MERDWIDIGNFWFNGIGALITTATAAVAVISFYIARASKREAAQANARADTASGEATEANERADAATARAAAAQEADIETRAFLKDASRLAASLESQVAAIAADGSTARSADAPEGDGDVRAHGGSRRPPRSSARARSHITSPAHASAPRSFAELLQALENASLQDQWYEPHQPKQK